MYFLEHALEAANAVIALGILVFLLRYFRRPSLPLQRRARSLFLVATAVFAMGEVLAGFGLALGANVESLKEVTETVFILLVAIAVYALHQSDRREVSALHLSASTDLLTGLLNHGTFRRAALRRLERARLHGLPLALILLDVDDFKAYNDHFGHEAGNAALQSIAAVLRNSARADDLVARYGGEEFVIMLVDTLPNALGTAERIRERVSSFPRFSTRQITVSVGVAYVDALHNTLEKLIEAADQEMYRAKKAGKNQVAPVEAAVREAVRLAH